MVKNYKVVDNKGKSTGVVEISSDVKVKFDNKEISFHIVGSSEADPSGFKISNESPMGKAFMGRKSGDVVEVETPGGITSYKILEVK